MLSDDKWCQNRSQEEEDAEGIQTTHLWKKSFYIITGFLNV